MKLKPTEHQEQTAVLQWAEYYAAKWPELKLLFAIPNGGARHVITAKKLKAEGVKAGVPDLFLPAARGNYHGLFIEMKVRPNKPSIRQSVWIAALGEQGYKVEICYSAEEGIEALRLYLGT